MISQVYSIGDLDIDLKSGLKSYRRASLIDPYYDGVRYNLLEHQRPEQSGFTPKRSRIDRILALQVLTEHRREFWQGLLAAYADLCKAFDSVIRDALWRILGLRGVPPKRIILMSELLRVTTELLRVL